MSDVASLELCKELYGLSGWRDTFLAYHQRLADSAQPFVDTWDEVWNITEIELHPAYDSGYLLRKLPRTLHDAGYWLYIESQPNQYAAYYCDPSHQLYFVSNNVYRAREYADTPEDALCLLAIELIRQGILQHE